MLIKTIGQTFTLTSQTTDEDYHALKNAPYPKVVCSTNVAESSVTITGVNMVIDLGKCKSVVVQPQTQITELKPEAITKASAIQRGGRAARRGKGGVFRLYFEEVFENLRNEGMPAYQTDLPYAMLMLAMCSNIHPRYVNKNFFLTLGVTTSRKKYCSKPGGRRKL